MLLPADLFLERQETGQSDEKPLPKEKEIVVKIESQNAGKENFLRNLNFFL